MLAKSTIAGQEAVITYLANAAALQQFEQTGLAYVLMHEAGRSMGAAGLAAAAESLLEGKFEVGFLVFPAEVCGHNTLCPWLTEKGAQSRGWAACMHCLKVASMRHVCKSWCIQASTVVQYKVLCIGLVCGIMCRHQTLRAIHPSTTPTWRTTQ